MALVSSPRRKDAVRLGTIGARWAGPLLAGMLVAALLALAAMPAGALAAVQVKPVYRLYNHRTSEHLYTTNKGEYDSLPTITNGDWRQEGVAWGAPATSKTPVYRLYNKKSGDHHYTTNKAEADVLCARHGWNREGIAFYSDDARAIPLFRLYNHRLWRGQHHYTASTRERDVLSSSWGWAREGVGFYGAKKWVVDKAAWDEPVYESVWVQDSAAWDEPVYTTTDSYWKCSDGYTCSSSAEAENHLMDVMESTGTMLSYWKVYGDTVQTGTIHHEATGHYEQRQTGTIHHEEVGHWE